MSVLLIPKGDVALDALAQLPLHLRDGNVAVQGMMYLHDEVGQAEGFADLSFYQSGQDAVCLEVSRDGLAVIRWEHSLSGAPLFRALIAEVVRLREGGRRENERGQALPPLLQAYRVHVIDAVPVPLLPLIPAVHLEPDTVHE